MKLNRRSIPLAVVAILVLLFHADAEQLKLTALGLRVEYRPENHWGPAFDRGNGGGPADHNTAMEVLLAKDGKSKNVLLTGSTVSKSDVQFDQNILTRIDGQAQRRDYRIKTKGFTKFIGLRAYKVVSESPELKRELVLYCFYSGDKVYAIIAASSDPTPVEKDEEIKSILDSIELIK